MQRSTLVLSVAWLGSVAAAAFFWSELRDERAYSAALAAQLEQARTGAHGVVRTEAARIVTATTPPAPVSEAPVAAATGDAQVVQGSQKDWDAYQARLMRDPKYREVRREQERLALAPRRANLIRLLGLTPAQADAAIDLQLDLDAQSNEVYRTADPTTDQARYDRRARLEALERAYQDRVRALIGEDLRAKLDTYMESRGTRMQVDRLRTDLDAANALRDDQVEPLITALQAERTQMQDDLQAYSDTLSWENDAQTDSWRSYSDKQAELWKTMNRRMHSSAASILTNAQLDALDALLAREFARFEAQQRLNRIQSKLDRPGAPAGTSD